MSQMYGLSDVYLAGHRLNGIYGLCIGNRDAAGMCWCSKTTASTSAVRPGVGTEIPHSKITGYTREAKVLVQVEKKNVDAGETTGVLHSLLKPAPSFSLLPETASRSPTAANTMKHHTDSMIFTYSPGLQHREPQHVPNRPMEGSKKTQTPQQTMAKIQRKCAKHLTVRVLSSLLSTSLSAAEHQHLHMRRVEMVHSLGLWLRGSEQAQSDQWGPGEEGESAYRRCIAPYGWALCVYGELRYAETVKGKRREMQGVCGEEDTWDCGTLPHPEAASSRCHAALRSERMRQELRGHRRRRRGLIVHVSLHWLSLHR